MGIIQGYEGPRSDILLAQRCEANLITWILSKSELCSKGKGRNRQTTTMPRKMSARPAKFKSGQMRIRSYEWSFARTYC